MYRIYKPAIKPAHCPLEDVEQITFVNYLAKHYPHIRDLMTHVKNEGKRTKGQADKDKAMGMHKGVSDIIIIARVPFVAELKRNDPSKNSATAQQKQYLLSAHNAGAFACLCYGHEALIQAFEDWRVNHDPSA